MLIGVISDTHNNLERIERALKYFKISNIRTIVHCGDWTNIETLSYFKTLSRQLNLKVYGVLGNRDIFHIPEGMISKDFQIFANEYFEVILNDKKVAICHGDKKNSLKNLSCSQKYDFVFTGHTHKPSISIFNQTTVINPGSTAFSIPLSKKFIPTVAIINIKSMKVEIVKLDK